MPELPSYEPQWSRGTSIGGYEIVDHLASGGMAEVYIAMPTQGGAPVVVKAMSRHLLNNEEFVRLFLDEAQLVATLNHPNIGQIYDRGQYNGIHYFVMEYVIGQSCREILNRASTSGGIPLAHTIDMTCQIAAALHYAHEKRAPDGSLYGVVHRDLSHSNVLVTFEGVVKLIDFGVAKSSLRSTVTSVGSLKGKIRYMSPEQLRGEPIDRRTDVFALGVMFWEMSTGAPLFRAPSDAAVMHRILFEDFPLPSEVLPGYPPALEAIVMKALAKKPSDRTATAEAFGRALGEFARSANLPRGGLRVFARQLFGVEIDSALSRVERLQSLPLGGRRSRPETDDEPEVTVTAPDAPRPAPLRFSTAPTTLGPGITPVAPRHASTPLPVAHRVSAASMSLQRSPAQLPRKRRRDYRLVLLGVLVVLVVGTGLLLSQYTSAPTRAPQPASGK